MFNQFVISQRHRRNWILVKSGCENESLFWAPNCVPRFECAPWLAVKKAIVDMLIRLKGNAKSTSGNSLNALRAQNKNWRCFVDATTGFPAKWRLRKERGNSILMTRHYPDLGSDSDSVNQIFHAARPIRITTQIWVVTRHQYGISALVCQTSFGRKTSGSVAKCRLFSQANFSLALYSTSQVHESGEVCHPDRRR